MSMVRDDAVEAKKMHLGTAIVYQNSIYLGRKVRSRRKGTENGQLFFFRFVLIIW